MPGVRYTLQVPELVIALTQPPGGIVNVPSLEGSSGMPLAGVAVVGNTAVAVLGPNARNTCCVLPCVSTLTP